MSTVRELQRDIEACSDDGEVLTLRLPWCPSVNAYWRSAAIKGTNRVVVYTTKEAKQYREDVGWLCAGARRFGSVEIEMDIVLHQPDRRARDADNNIKALFDALQAARIFNDDVQVQKYTVTKSGVAKFGLMVVKIWEMPKC